MTERPYTDEDLRAEAARQHASLTEDPDYMGIGERMEDSTVTSTKDGTAPLTWAKSLVPEGGTYEAFDEPQRAIHKLISRAADTSRWAVDLGADGLVPDEHVITIGGEQTAARIHFAFAPGLDDGQRAAIVHAVAHHVGDCDTCAT